MPSCATSISVPSYTIIPSSFNSTSTPISSSSTAKLLTQHRRNHLIGRKSMTYQRKGVVRAAISIEKETPEAERPETFLRGGVGSVRTRFEKMIREAQDSVCSAIEVADGGAKFKEDVWSRPGGGSGISRVLQDGVVWEKAGVNPDAYRAAIASGDQKPGPVPFFAAGISSVSNFINFNLIIVCAGFSVSSFFPSDY